MTKWISIVALASVTLSGAAFAGPIGGSTGNTGGYVLCKDGGMYGYYNPGSTNYGPDVSYEHAVEMCKLNGGGLATFNPRSGPIRLNAGQIKAVKIEAIKRN
jgi:hypothetical protein